ncbi:MAG: dienelactone hydrolase family protein [Burkholderia contaminans]|uniref:Dienelactone hydrolase family protein n=1 Tax=Burkholderia contaminans TaxID=488447 RepID=A0AAP4R1Q4_9BURK|nr:MULTISPECIES: dienelactone hydrolase family protein [Burkholderia]MBD1411924.1 dienelactone hydrolase family protein [Burkholderia contaminans]MBH9666848.1 dienelactone hydrolase family protein [Burkholderia contaminans]MBH9673605.1 dienelactone hydrolase family protein [Burkholderia contaminans]MBH9703649.1 dienelactone hydrolase family protein [Burkholderia contaminans]MBH9719893.1 dienelactone hydrolase family protein [Burkholderia contaminans]
MLKPEVDSLVPHVPFSRRKFMQAALGGAFAAAVLPVSAQTVTTDSEGLDVDTVEIRSGDASVPAYRAQPKDKTNLPVVIVIHEIFGVHAHIADVCRRFAKLGYLAIAPDLFARQGNAEKYPTIKDLVDHIVSKVPDRQVTEDLDATVAWAGKNGGDLSRLGVVGFCWGGRQSWLYAEHNPHVRAAVAWYGFVEGKTDEMTPFNPVDHASLLKVPVLGLYGEKDTNITQASLANMRKAIQASDSKLARESEIVVYPDAGHAFFADYRPSYVKADAEESWKRAIAWLHKYGVM